MAYSNGLRLALLVGAFLLQTSTALAFYPNATPNYGVGGRECITCHNNVNGGSGCGSSPCLNNFGNQFRNNGRVWNSTLASWDADGDGFSNGRELMDPWGQWDIGDPNPGSSWYVTDPAAWNSAMSECSIGSTTVDGWYYAYNNCSTNAWCYEANGSPGFTCSCKAGYQGNGVSCTDVDECAQNPSRCGPGSCANTPGAFTCNCNSGYYFNGVTCTQDACVTNIDDCNSPNATCTPSPTNPTTQWTCGCAQGYTGGYQSQVCTWYDPFWNICWEWAYSNWQCFNVDECTSGAAGCPTTSACVDTPGSFTCSPCGMNTHVVGAVNNESCVCNVGFHGDPYSGCADDDECADNTDNCGVNANCTNTAGSFTCACAPGYAGDGYTCTEIDECALGTDSCSPHATCVNSPVGTYTCTCNANFTGNGVTCADVNECANNTHTCSPNETCVNVYGAPHTCVCNPGYAPETPGGPCVSSCGNGLRATREGCDDGNVVSGDGCSDACEIEDGYACYEPGGAESVCRPTCGDGLIDPPAEECDDAANNSNTAPNACRTTCKFAHCGDGVLDANETCDTGADVSDVAIDACRSTCVPAYCGDGVVDTGERCDPGGNEALDPSECQRKRCTPRAPADGGVDGGIGNSQGGGCATSPARGESASVLGLLALAWLATRRKRTH